MMMLFRSFEKRDRFEALIIYMMMMMMREKTRDFSPFYCSKMRFIREKEKEVK